jgi:hypothetical protein
MPIAPAFKKVLQAVRPALDASLDPVAIVDTSNRVVYANVSMKNFLRVTAQQFKKSPVFCDLIHLNVCDKSCQIIHMIKTAETLRLDETPANRKDEKLRLLLKGVPLYDLSDINADASPIGAILTVRDTTGEVLLQAKYHKILQLLTEKEGKITELLDRLSALRGVLRRARGA